MFIMLRYILIFLILCLTGYASKAQLNADFTIQNQLATYCHPEDLTFVSTTTGGTPPYSYDWNFGVAPGTQANTQTAYYLYFNCGNYTVTLNVTDAAGQTSTKTQTVIINCSPFGQFGMNDTVVCVGQKVGFKDFSFTYYQACTYSWNFDDPLSGISNESTAQDPYHEFYIPGSYEVMMVVTSPAGCPDTVYNTVTVLPTPSVTVDTNITICPGTTAVLNASGATQYQWEPSIGLSNTFLATTLASPTVTTTYTVTTGSLGGCQAMDSIVVTVSLTGTADAGDNKMICTGGDVELEASGMTSCTWSPAIGLNTTTGFNVMANPLSTTVYFASGPDLNGCQITDSVVVYILPLPTANAGADLTICDGEKAELYGSGGNSFSWEPALEIENNTSYHGTASPSVNATYTLTVSNGGTCISTDTVVVTVLSKPVINVIANPFVCPGSSVQLQANGAVSYQWQADPTLSQSAISNPIASPVAQTTYVVTGFGNNGCKDTAQIIIYQKPPVELTAMPGGSVCPGSDIQLFAEGATSYEWYPSTGLDNPFIPTPIASPPYSITYKVKGSDGCTSDSTYVQVTIIDDPGVKAADDQQTFANNPVSISAEGTGSFTWSPPQYVDCSTCQNTTATVNETTTFIVTNYNDAGCKTEDTLVVYVGCNADLIFIPNAFTPNGDGKNERFYIRTQGLRQLNYFKIYSRTGQCVFETNTVSDGWDGSYNGYKLPPGVFSYFVEVICSDNQKIVLTGNVTLIR